MKNKVYLPILVVLGLVGLSLGISSQPRKVQAQNNSNDPTWWSKYEFIRDNGGDASPLSTTSTTVNGNVDVSNECGPQSETFITINPNIDEWRRQLGRRGLASAAGERRKRN